MDFAVPCFVLTVFTAGSGLEGFFDFEGPLEEVFDAERFGPLLGFVTRFCLGAIVSCRDRQCSSCEDEGNLGLSGIRLRAGGGKSDPCQTRSRGHKRDLHSTLTSTETSAEGMDKKNRRCSKYSI